MVLHRPIYRIYVTKLSSTVTYRNLLFVLVFPAIRVRESCNRYHTALLYPLPSTPAASMKLSNSPLGAKC